MDEKEEKTTSGKEEDEISIRSDDTTIIENSISSRRVRNGSVSAEAYAHLFKRLEDATVVRNRLELQNEQLLQQWEQALEYSAKVQRELEEEIGRKAVIQEENVILLQRKNETIVIPRSLAVNVLLLFFVSFILYLILG
ncbi:hypothetical protein PRIPAC_94986 [Pristionchus pacificus]|uniref:Uncharacterized protein n=1 Tax=Pristionchus pacificus TaxID=54126 RepID=A0A8R1V4Q4_PRIPA|nr:hypothetical protein PRIPAC_94986 [Pristionchus pacificus]